MQMLLNDTGSLFPVIMNGKWGYMNGKKQVVIEPQFDGAENFYEGLAVVWKDTSTGESVERLYGYIDINGSFVTQCNFTRALNFSEGLAAVERGGKFGFVDKHGREVIPFQFEEASKFSQGRACVKIAGKNGFIDRLGNIVIQPQFARACWVSDFSEGLAAVYTSEQGGGGYIDTSGRMVIEPKFSYVGSFSEGLAQVKPDGSNLHGYLNKKGEMVIQPQYELGLPFSGGVAAVKLQMSDGQTAFRIINTKGEVIADRLNYAFVGIFRDGRAGVETFDQRWGFIDTKGKVIIKPKFSSVKLYENGLSRVETGSFFKGLRVQYIDKTGNVFWKEP